MQLSYTWISKYSFNDIPTIDWENKNVGDKLPKSISQSMEIGFKK